MGLQREVCFPNVVASENHHAPEEDRSCEDHYGELAVEEIPKIFQPAGDRQAQDGEGRDEGVGVEGDHDLDDVEEEEGGEVDIDH